MCRITDLPKWGGGKSSPPPSPPSCSTATAAVYYRSLATSIADGRKPQSIYGWMIIRFIRGRSIIVVSTVQLACCKTFAICCTPCHHLKETIQLFVTCSSGQCSFALASYICTKTIPPDLSGNLCIWVCWTSNCWALNYSKLWILLFPC